MSAPYPPSPQTCAVKSRDRRPTFQRKTRQIIIASPKKNSGGRFMGCSARGMQAIRRVEFGEKVRPTEVGCGIGCNAECTFSDLKRLFGDTVTARRPERTALELFRKVRIHNFCKDLPAEPKSGSVKKE